MSRNLFKVSSISLLEVSISLKCYPIYPGSHILHETIVLLLIYEVMEASMLVTSFRLLSNNKCFTCFLFLHSDSRGLIKEEYSVILFSVEAVLMSTYNICFYGEVEKIIPELSTNTTTT